MKQFIYLIVDPHSRSKLYPKSMTGQLFAFEKKYGARKELKEMELRGAGYKILKVRISSAPAQWTKKDIEELNKRARERGFSHK